MYFKKVRKKEKIILSEKFSIKLINHIHESMSHIGIIQMQKNINPLYIAKNIKKVCEICNVCIKNKSRGQDKFGLMSHLGPAKKPFEIMSIDTIGGFGV